MQLKFYAKPEHLQPWPASHSYGQPRRYIGWQWVAPDLNVEKSSARYDVKRDGDVVDEALIPSAIVDEIKRACRQGALIAANEETAKACDVDFAEHTFSEAGFLPKAEAEPAPTPSTVAAEPAPAVSAEPEPKAAPSAKTKADKAAKEGA